MTDNRNMLTAIVLSALVLIGWSFLAPRFLPTATPPTTHIVDGEPLPQPTASPGGSPATPAVAATKSRAEVLGSTPRVKITTPSLTGSLNLKGARIDDLLLVRQRETIDPASAPVRLFSPQGAPHSYFASFGWLAGAGSPGIATPTADTPWQASSRLLSPGHPVTLSWTNPTGQKFEQIVAVDGGYLFTVTQKITNGGAGPVTLAPDGLVSRADPSRDMSSWTTHIGPVGVYDGAANYDVTFASLNGEGPGFFSRIFGSSAKVGTTSYQANSAWLGFTDKYWLAALAPAGPAPISASLRKGAGGYQADYASVPMTLAPGQAASSATRLFAGAKEKIWLDKYEAAGITKLTKSIDWGWFEWFMRPIFWLLSWLFHATGNFGVAIICLTLIVRTIMFPIADKSFRSMAAMRRVQPKMKTLQDRHKDDKPRLQQEMLKLYQEEKVNPAGGCLPVLIQIPVFYALYKVLMVSVEMRHQPFALWIKDLSAHDPMTPVNLFGLLHFTPPAMLAVGVLPIIMGVTMWMQFKLNPQQPDPVQQQIFSIMPVMMTVIMAPFAAGLLLYWCVSNILTILQQKWLYHRYDLERAPEPAKA